MHNAELSIPHSCMLFCHVSHYVECSIDTRKQVYSGEITSDKQAKTPINVD